MVVLVVAVPVFVDPVPLLSLVIDVPDDPVGVVDIFVFPELTIVPFVVASPVLRVVSPT